jgi:CTP:molybdopterin cytidylyltransferase MocA
VRHADGRLLVERAAEVLRAGGCAPIYVVVGAEADRVRAEADLGDASLVDNPGWKTGMGSSLKVGLAALTATGADAAIVLHVDTPSITPEAVSRLIGACDGPSALLAATYEGRRGHPVLLGREHWAGVSLLASADVGARAYLLAHSGQVKGIPCEDVADDTDVDVPPAAEATTP